MAIFGVGPYGYGTPAATAMTSGGQILKDSSSGASQGSRQIDPLTKDYVLSSTGRIAGMSNTKQLVYMAVLTTKGSAAMRSLGQEIMLIERITSNFVRRVDTTLRAAVQHLVDREFIEVIGTEVAIVRPGVAKARFRWRDTASGEEDETETSI